MTFAPAVCRAATPVRRASRPRPSAKIGPLLDDAVAKRQIAGGAALIARHGKVVYLATAGRRDAEAGLPVDETTIYRIASMTKPITSVAVMMLCEEGKIGLDDPVSTYSRISGTDGPRRRRWSAARTCLTVPARREITIRDLLTHTSGLSYRFFDRPGLGKLYADSGVSDGLCETPGTVADNVGRLAKLPLLHQPGTAWEYSLSTDVLGRVVEVVSGQDPR